MRSNPEPRVFGDDVTGFALGDDLVPVTVGRSEMRPHGLLDHIGDAAEFLGRAPVFDDVQMNERHGDLLPGVTDMWTPPHP